MTPFVEAARQLMRGLVWGSSLLPEVSHDGRRLEWRHHGLGMLQAELSEALRIHIWHPDLVDPKMAWPRCVHDHRFDLVSAVVVGAVIDVPCRVSEGSWWRGPKPPPPYSENVHVHEIAHAKVQFAEGPHAAAAQPVIMKATLTSYESELHGAGTEYRLVKRVFHTTRVEDLAITVVHRSNFDSEEWPARVLCAPDADVTAVSGIVRDEGVEHRVLVNHVLRKAAVAIARLDSAP